MYVYLIVLMSGFLVPLELDVKSAFVLTLITFNHCLIFYIYVDLNFLMVGLLVCIHIIIIAENNNKFYIDVYKISLSSVSDK